MRGVGAHDDGPVAGGGAAHGGGRCNRCLTHATLAGEEDYPHGRSLRSGCRRPSGLDGWTRPSGASRHLPTLWGGVTPLRRFAPPPHSVGRSYAPPALAVSLRSGRSPPLTG